MDTNTDVKPDNSDAGKDFDTIADNFLDQQENPSISKDGDKAEAADAPGSDQAKKDDTAPETKKPSIEDKLKQISEILGDDEETINAYIKQKGYGKDPAWQRLLAKSRQPQVDPEIAAALEDFKKTTSSREYIEASMRAKGYTQEAIDGALQEKGFNVTPRPGDDVELVIKSLSLDPKAIDDNSRTLISDVAKIADVIFKDRVSKTLPSALKPIEENLSEITRKESAYKLTNKMQGIIKDEGILDFQKDIEPVLREWIDKNPNATQEDIFNSFLEYNHRLSIERLKSGKKQVDREEAKGNLRNNVKSAPQISKPSDVKRTGNFDDDFDAMADALNLR